MKRDMELIRKILLFIEALPPGNASVALAVPGYSTKVIEYHALMLVERGLLKPRAGVILSQDGVGVFPAAITFEGHDFLDTARNDTIWHKAMEKVGSTTGSVSLEVLKALLADLGKKALGL